MEAKPWCPDVCPFTLLPFFSWVSHPELGIVPTYGGPFDSYTIPEPVMPIDGPLRIDVQYERYRFDHDAGHWVNGVEIIDLRVVAEETLIDLNAWGDQ
jgi:hypothetical protein